MTNRERYKKAFSAIQTSGEFSLEVEKMKRIKRQHRIKAMAASIAGIAVFMASASVAYAMDVGGIQRTVQLWIQGDRTDATIRFDGDGTYGLTYTCLLYTSPSPRD